MTDGLCKQSISLVVGSLLAAYKNPDSLKAREALAYGSLLAGLALANARLGAVHGIAHPLGAKYHLPHGLTVGLLLPYVIEFNCRLPKVKDKYDYIGRIIGAKNAEGLVDYLKQLLAELKYPSGLKDLGVKPSSFAPIAELSIDSGSLKANPRSLSRADIIAILKKSL